MDRVAQFYSWQDDGYELIDANITESNRNDIINGGNTYSNLLDESIVRITVGWDDETHQPNWLNADKLQLTVSQISAPITQHAGDTRFETATKASQKAYPDPTKVDAVIISFSHNFPDALAASYLAGVADAPILLTLTTTLHQATLAELNRLKPKTIYITGSTTVIGSGVEQTLKGLSFKPTVTRLAGNVRTQTAVAIANEAKRIEGTPQTAFVVYASNYPDALSVGSLSASRHVPILLTDKDTLSPETQKYLIDNAIKDIIVIGGSPAVSDKVVTQLKGLSTKPAVVRWSGPDRYATAKDVVDKATTKWKIAPTSVGIALGDNFPDALVGGAAMGNRDGILVISPPKTLSDAARTVITTNKTTIQGVEIFGGTNVIDVKSAVQGLLS
jgi:putative cell wall-binding protein